jgi:hypothetical protein
VAWPACFGGQRRLISRFSVEPASWFAIGRGARLFRSADAEPFVPFVGELFPSGTSAQFEEQFRALRKKRWSLAIAPPQALSADRCTVAPAVAAGRGMDGFAPIPDLPALAAERRGSTQLRDWPRGFGASAT